MISWLLIPLVFFLGSPYILRDFGQFWQGFSYIVGQFTSTGANVADYFLVDHWTGLFYLWVYLSLFSIGIPGAIFACVSLGAAWQQGRRPKTDPRHSLMICVSMIVGFVLLYSLVALRTIRPGHSANLLILIIPFIALLAGIGADWLIKRIPVPPRYLMPLIALILITQPLILSVQVVKMFSQPDSRHIILDWIYHSIPRGSRFMLNGPYNVPLDEALYPSDQQFGVYASPLPSGEDYDYMIYSDALAFDIFRSHMIVPDELIQQQHDFLQMLDDSYSRIAKIARPSWTGSEAMMNMAAYWHNPTLIVYCLNPKSCAAHTR